MKLCHTILLGLVIACVQLCQPLFAQQPLMQINIINFTVKNKLSADINNWANLPTNLILTAQKIPTAQLRSIKLVIQIKLNGSKICGTLANNTLAVDAFSVRNYNAADLSAMIVPCNKLTPNRYSLSAQFFNEDNYPISREASKEFEVGDAVFDYTTPQNISPIQNKIFTATSIVTPIIFRWLPILPKQKNVIYRLRIWQIMQGQTATQAINANEPIAEKEVKNINQTIVNNLNLSPCTTATTCNFAWAVQALDIDGKPIGRNNGLGEWFIFSIK